MPRDYARLDARANDLIRRSVSYTAFFRKGPHETYRVDCPTLGEARKAADELTAEHGQYGRRAVVYGISPEGWTTPIPASWQA